LKVSLSFVNFCTHQKRTCVVFKLTYFAAFWIYKGGAAVLQALKLMATEVEEVKRNFAAAEVFLVAVTDFAQGST
jgi:hypothetical protein